MKVFGEICLSSLNLHMAFRASLPSTCWPRQRSQCPSIPWPDQWKPESYPGVPDAEEELPRPPMSSQAFQSFQILRPVAYQRCRILLGASCLGSEVTRVLAKRASASCSASCCRHPRSFWSFGSFHKPRLVSYFDTGQLGRLQRLLGQWELSTCAIVESSPAFGESSNMRSQATCVLASKTSCPQLRISAATGSEYIFKGLIN